LMNRDSRRRRQGKFWEDKEGITTENSDEAYVLDLNREGGTLSGRANGLGKRS